MRYIFLLVIVAIFYTSNPSVLEHQQAVKNKINKVVKNNFPSENGIASDNIMSTLGGLFVDGLVNGAVESYVTRKDYFLFSITNIDFNGESRVIGVGLLGKVRISDEFVDVIKQTIEKEKRPSTVIIN
jgi:hypothetical protein